MSTNIHTGTHYTRVSTKPIHFHPTFDRARLCRYTLWQNPRIDVQFVFECFEAASPLMPKTLLPYYTNYPSLYLMHPTFKEKKKKVCNEEKELMIFLAYHLIDDLFIPKVSQGKFTMGQCMHFNQDIDYVFSNLTIRCYVVVKITVLLIPVWRKMSFLTIKFGKQCV